MYPYKDAVERRKAHYNAEIERKRRVYDSLSDSTHHELREEIDREIDRLAEERDAEYHRCTCTCGCENETRDKGVCIDCHFGSHARKDEKKREQKTLRAMRQLANIERGYDRDVEDLRASMHPF